MSREIQITLPSGGINDAKLTQELQAAYPDVFGVLSGRPSGTYIQLPDDSTLTQADLQAVVDLHDASVPTDDERRQQNTNTAFTDLLTLADFAQDYAQDIAALYVATHKQIANSTTTDDVWDDVRTALAAADSAFQNQFIQRFETESSITLALGSLGLLTVSQKRAINQFARTWSSGLLNLLIIKRVVG